MRRFSVHSLRSRVWVLGIVLAVGLAAAGCKKTTNIAITMSPTTATVLVGNNTQFTATSSNGGAVNWAVNGVANGNTTVGTVSSSGLYTAPLSVPTNTTITVTATLQTDSSITASATVTLDSGVRVNITPTSFTLGTGETLQFSAIVTGVPLNASRQPNGTAGDLGCNAISAPPTSVPYCNTVTWSVSPTQTAPAGFSTTTPGLFTAPGSATSVVITATSVFDTSRTGTASVSIVAAPSPVLSSVSPNTAPRGGLLQDVYLTGMNFLSTTSVFVNGTQIPSSNVLVPQPGVTATNSTVGTLMHIRLSDLTLATPPVPPATSTTLTFTVAPQVQGTNGPVQCASAPNLAPCQLSLVPVRPAVVGASPDSIPQGSGSPVAFSVNGGFFGTAQNPTVTAFYGGNEAKFPTISSTNSTRQMTVTIGGSGNAGDVSTPGLFPVAITSNANPGASVVTNIAVQPSYPASTISRLVQFNNSATGGNVGTAPSGVAINTATGVAVVANQGSNDVELIDLTKTTPAVIGFICTGAKGSMLTPTESGSCAAAGPVSVAVDNVANVALVANAGTSTIALVDLTQNAQQVLQVTPVPNNNSLTTPAPFVPVAIGVNPLNHIGIVAYQSTNVASLLTVMPTTPASFVLSGVVNTSTGASPRVSVSQRLDWALVTPGGLGSLSVVDLAKQTTNGISSASRTAGIATITTATAQNVQVGTPVLISNVGNGFDGVYQVLTIPSSTTFTYSQTNQSLSNATVTGSNLSSVSYGFPVATLATSTTIQGVAFNDQTQKAVLTDPGGSTPGSVFAALDQTSTTIPLPTTNLGDTNFNLATAVNPLANLALSVNEHTGDVFVIDPNAPAVLTTISAEGINPVDVAIDPATNIAVFANQGSPSSISIYSLGAIRPLQVLQASVSSVLQQAPCPQLVNPVLGGPSVLVCSAAAPVAQTLTIIGSGFTPSSKVRLDGQVLAAPSSPPSTSRVLTAIVDTATQAVPRRFSLDVADSGAVSNSTSFTVARSVNLSSSGSCITPSPQAVAIDPQFHSGGGEALVTDSGVGCNQVYLIDIANGALDATTAGTGIVKVGTTPVGVASFSRLGVGVVANQADNTASVVDETSETVKGTVSLDNGPTGVAVDQDLGEALVTATSANLADQFSVSGTPGNISVGTSSSLTVQQNPTAVAVDSVTHFAAVGNVSNADVTVLSLSNSAVSNSTSPGSVQIPQGIAVDPCPASTCNANEEFVPNPNFLITASLQNQVEALDPTTGVLTPLRVGINPTALAYNPLASTLVTVNTLSQTMTVVDYLSKQVRAVFPLMPSSQFGVAIMPQTNLAVVADPTNSRVLLFPLPY